MKLAAVLVHYHTPELARGACAALVRDASASDLELETVLVDNGSRPEDSDVLAAVPARVLDPGRNLGYAGGVNLGVRETSAEHVVVMNPDVEVLPGCLAGLIAALEDGAAAAGPRFYWDRRKRFLLPPTEPVSRRAELLAVLAKRGGSWARFARRSWRRHARRYWLASSALVGYDLSGALLAFRREAWRSVGTFDERYRLYFEETDWLQRLRAARLEASYVPSAEAVHLYAQSTVREGRAADWFLESSRRFRRRVYGPAFTSLLERLGGGGRAAAPLDEEAPSRAAEWLEVSPSAAGYPAAAGRFSAAEQVDLPEEIRARLAPGTYYLRSLDGEGREVGLRGLTVDP